MDYHHILDFAYVGDINGLYEAVAIDPSVLERIDEIPFVTTPLHVAARNGHTNLAVEVMRLKPSFSKKLDTEGHSPFHLALKAEQTSTVLRLLEIDPDLVRVKGREGFTPLHYVAQRENLQLLNEFLKISPSSITDTTNLGETVLHIVVKTGNIQALEALLAFLRRSWYKEALYWEEKVLNWKDQYGHTVLHVAASMNQLQAMKLLLNCNIHVNARSLDNKTALDIVNEAEPVNTEMKDLLVQAGALSGSSVQIDYEIDDTGKQLSFKSPKLTLFENVMRFLKGQKTNISTESRDALLVVAALVATATFQAVLSPPGGLRQADSGNSDALPFSKVGKVVMKEWLYIIFLLANGTSFWVTIITIFLLLPHGFYGWLLTVPLVLLSTCYLFCSTVISPSLVCAVVNLGLFVLFVILLPLGLVFSSGRGRRFLKLKKLGLRRKSEN